MLGQTSAKSGKNLDAISSAKLVRKHGASRTGADRELFIEKSNSFVVCARLSAKYRGGICLKRFDWSSLTPDWSLIEQQICKLAPPHILGPPLVPY